LWIPFCLFLFGGNKRFPLSSLHALLVRIIALSCPLGLKRLHLGVVSLFSLFHGNPFFAGWRFFSLACHVYLVLLRLFAFSGLIFLLSRFFSVVFFFWMLCDCDLCFPFLFFAGVLGCVSFSFQPSPAMPFRPKTLVWSLSFFSFWPCFLSLLPYRRMLRRSSRLLPPFVSLMVTKAVVPVHPLVTRRCGFLLARLPSSMRSADFPRKFSACIAEELNEPFSPR